MTRLLMALFVAFGIGIVVVAPTAAQADIDCADIATPGDAQRILAQDPSDPFGIDTDDDNKPCEAGVGGGSVTFETIYGAPAASSDGMALPATGAGVMAGGTLSTTAITLAALAVVSGLVGATMRPRRA